MAEERTGHPLSYAEAKKMKLLTLKKMKFLLCNTSHIIDIVII